MSVRMFGVATFLSGAALLLTAAPASAVVCDAYSGGCVDVPAAAQPAQGEVTNPATGEGGGQTDAGAGSPGSDAGPGTAQPVQGEVTNPATGETGGTTGAAAGTPTQGEVTSPARGEIGTSGTSARTLPFTGAELVLMTALGAGALAAGAALGAAGRRRGLGAA